MGVHPIDYFIKVFLPASFTFSAEMGGRAQCIVMSECVTLDTLHIIPSIHLTEYKKIAYCMRRRGGVLAPVNIL